MIGRNVRARLRLAAIAALAAAVSPGCRTTTDIQRDYAKTLAPPRVEGPAADAAPETPLRTFRVRLYAHADYQRTTLHWEEKLQAQVERTNRALGPTFGVRLVAEPVRTWSTADGGGSLAQALESLMAVDAGGDVDWVIGFVPASEAVAVADQRLGVAIPFGRHVVVRAMQSRDEREALDAALDELSAAERENVVHERVRHRETVVLLHEWAHTLGAFHERAPEWLMSPQYGTRESRFSEESAAIVRLGLRHRGARDPAARAEWARAYRELVTRSTSAWDSATRDAALAAAEAFFAGGPSLAGAVAPPPAASERDRACLAAAARSVRSAETLAACRTAADAPEAGAEALVATATVLVAREDRPAAARALVRAERALDARGATATTWLRVAQLYVEAEACSGAERLAGRAAPHPGADVIRSDCARVRRECGLAAVSPALEPDREAEYVAGIREGERHVAASRSDLALEVAARLERTFPGAPGAALVTCRARAAGKDRAATRKACEAAAAAAPDAPQPRRALGEVSFAERRWPDAVLHLRRAIELDDGDGGAWTRLAAAYERLGDAAAREALGARYQARFGSALRARDR